MQLRVDPHGRTYSTLTDHAVIPFHEEQQEEDVKDTVKAPHQPEKNISEEEDVGVVLPLSRKHLEMFTRMSAPSFRTTVRTDTVSTTLEQDTDVDCDNLDDGGKEDECTILCFFPSVLCWKLKALFAFSFNLKVDPSKVRSFFLTSTLRLNKS